VAPKLDPHELTYHNEEEGFQFTVTSGWLRHSFSRFPPGTQAKEALWVKYRNLKATGLTFFRASFIDLPETTTVASYLSNLRPGPENWRLIGQAEKTTAGGLPATRYRFTGTWDHDAMVKEVLAVQRGKRTIFFTGIYPIKDTVSRDAVRGFCKSIQWDARDG
jgi:hypothetical protein